MEREAEATVRGLHAALMELVAPLELEFDPNMVDPKDPALSVAVLPADVREPKVGERVTLVQPDDDDYPFIGVGRVARVDSERGLIALAVDWPSFHTVGETRTISETHVRRARDTFGVQWTMRGPMAQRGARLRERMREAV